ncbi:MAG: SGNH/GDSL hydrolase family protein [Bacteroidota bacterium]
MKKGITVKPFFKKTLYGLYLFFIVFILLEIALRIYNPFHFRLKGDKIVLPANQKIIISNHINPKLDSVITNTRNSLGFRGPEPPANAANALTIITIGGSTTECHFLSDNNTWPFLLEKGLGSSFNNIWINNAGLDGHSTFGHIVLLNDYIKKIKPAVVLFLVGINDVEMDQPSFHDKLNTRGAYADFKHYIFENSEVLSLILNIVRGGRAQKFNNTTNRMMLLNNSNLLTLPEETIQKRMVQQKEFLTGFHKRLVQIADTCLYYGITPVFITQPDQFGGGLDSTTGTNLALYRLRNDINGTLEWRLLELYNDVTRETAREKNIFMIDLARLLPKDSRYFYDNSHFTNAGAEKVASLVKEALQPMLSNKFPAQLKK